MATALATAIKQHLLTLGFHTNPDTLLQTGFRICELLFDAQCCYRCVPRFLQCFDLSIYEAPEKDLEMAFQSLLPNPISNNGACTTCVGTLQQADLDSFANDAYKRYQNEDYKSQQVSLSATLPLAIMHRDWLMKTHIDDHLDDSFKQTWAQMTICDAKVPFKHLFGKNLGKCTPLSVDTSSPLQMAVVIENKGTEDEHMFLTQTKKGALKIRKVRRHGIEHTLGDSRGAVANALEHLEKDEAKRLTTIPPTPPTDLPHISNVTFKHGPSFVAGRYLKYSRECSQTPWSVRGQKLAEISVSESICDILKKYYHSDDVKFCTAGREDANVRMLGNGRPFYCEMVNPRRPVLPTEAYEKMQDEINESKYKEAVQVRLLSAVQPEDISLIKEGEERKKKEYSALIWASDPLTDQVIEKFNTACLAPITLKQKTPVRVFQRRAALVREKTIYKGHLERVEGQDHFGILTLETQAGTYIKEFVHGDLGRTMPNLATLLGVEMADLLELDVTHVDLEWPPHQI